MSINLSTSLSINLRDLEILQYTLQSTRRPSFHLRSLLTLCSLMVLPFLIYGCTETPPSSSTSSIIDSPSSHLPHESPQFEKEPWTLPQNPKMLRDPEPPRIMRDVHLINDQIEFTRPYIPGHRTTMDGRVAVRVQGGFPGTERISQNYSFFLFVPEGIEEPIISGPPGAQILKETEPFDVIFPPALEPGINRFGHHVICDPTEYFEVEGERPNPYPCGPQEQNDCYEITLVSATASTLTAQLWATSALIEVEHPKTVQARIIRADLGEPIRGPEIPATNELLEPAITRDGKLLTARLGRAPRHWINPNTGESQMGFYDLVYFPPKEGMDPCDVNAWTQWHPMSHAPYDPQMIGRYGLAAYPFRDSEGQPIADGDDLGGTYPWVDREGANVFMSGIPGRMIEQSEVDYPRKCVVERCEQYAENNDWDRGFLVGGLWTQGKFVLLDSMINHLDWAIGVTPEAHYLVDLYTDPQGNSVPVRLGAGRFIDSVRNRGGPYPAGYTHNANILDSLQNLMNQHPNLKPVTPRDVVWMMSNGVATDEVVFDDFLDPNAFIISDMQASITQFYGSQGQSLAVPKYWNGQVRRLKTQAPIPAFNELFIDETEEIHIQNGATSLTWNLPSFGRVEAGEGRIEPAALGGIKGKGFWLNGANQIEYEIPFQSPELTEKMEKTIWTYSLFIDPRGQEEERRILLTFPDQSLIELVGTSTLQYVQDQEIIHRIELPKLETSSGWSHLGWRVDPQNKQVEFLYNGFVLDRFQNSSPLFIIHEGILKLGHRGESESGFRGWIDEFKVLAHDLNDEVACNHAHGTLIEVLNHDLWREHAEYYPSWVHQELAQRLPSVQESMNDPTQRQFACFHNYHSDYAAHLRNIPEGTLGLREHINFPEGPIIADQPRPDSTENQFCLSCHSDQGKGGLSVDALRFNSALQAQDDPRRQPHQPPRRVFGNIPAHWLSKSPDHSFQAPPEGVVIDHWLE